MNKLKDISQVAYIKTFLLLRDWLPLIGLTLLVFLITSGAAHADNSASVDYLAKVKPAVKGTFGKDSTFEWLAYIGEAVACMWRYLTTQNIVWFVGMPVVMAFTYAFLN